MTTLEIQIGSQRRCQSVQLRHGPAEPLGSGGGGEHALSRSDSLTWKWKTTWFVKKRQSSKGPGHPLPWTSSECSQVIQADFPVRT